MIRYQMIRYDMVRYIKIKIKEYNMVVNYCYFLAFRERTSL